MCDQWSILRSILLPNFVVLNVYSSVAQKQPPVIRILTDHTGLTALTFLIHLYCGIKLAPMSVTRAILGLPGVIVRVRFMFWALSSEYKQVEHSCCNHVNNTHLIAMPKPWPYRGIFFCRHRISSIKKPSISWVCYKHYIFVCGWPVSSSLDRRALVDDRSLRLTKLRSFARGRCECKEAITRDTAWYHQVW